MARQIPFCAICRDYIACGRIDIPGGDLFEWTAESFEDAVELNPHLQCERPARIVVRRCRGRAGICEDIWMLLWFEHIHDVGSKSLCSKDYIRPRRVSFTQDLKLSCCAMHGDA